MAKYIKWEYDEENQIFRISSDSEGTNGEEQFSFKITRYKDENTKKQYLEIESFSGNDSIKIIRTNMLKLAKDIKSLEEYGIILDNISYNDLMMQIRDKFLSMKLKPMDDMKVTPADKDIKLDRVLNLVSELIKIEDEAKAQEQTQTSDNHESSDKAQNKTNGNHKSSNEAQTQTSGNHENSDEAQSKTDGNNKSTDAKSNNNENDGIFNLPVSEFNRYLKDYDYTDSEIDSIKRTLRKEEITKCSKDRLTNIVYVNKKVVRVMSFFKDKVAEKLNNIEKEKIKNE